MLKRRGKAQNNGLPICGQESKTQQRICGDGVKQAFSDAVDGVVSTWQGVKQWFADLWKGIKSTISSIVDSIKDAIMSRFGVLIYGIRNAFIHMSLFLSTLWENLGKIAGQMFEIFEKHHLGSCIVCYFDDFWRMGRSQK